MAFFVGPVDELGKVDETKGHDVGFVNRGAQRADAQYLGRKIGEAGQQFALDHWSWANMQAYVSCPAAGIAP